jgi:hypothetical protein
MIVIHIEVLPEQPDPDDALVLYEPENYPAVRHQIRAAIDTSEDLDIYVKHPVCCSWFWDLADYGFVHIVNDGPVKQLERKLGVPMIPTELVENPGRILELGLLDLPDPCKKVEDVWNWIIEQKLGKTWAASGSLDMRIAIVRLGCAAGGVVDGACKHQSPPMRGVAGGSAPDALLVCRPIRRGWDPGSRRGRLLLAK